MLREDLDETLADGPFWSCRSLQVGRSQLTCRAENANFQLASVGCHVDLITAH